MVQLIWAGDICKHSSALALIHVVNQIHNYAITRHLPFVLKHLEAWYVWEKQQRKQPTSYNTNDQPPWFKLMEATKKKRQEKAQETRKRNRTHPDPAWRPSRDTEPKAKRRRAC
jgi:hypothetical protein